MVVLLGTKSIFWVSYNCGENFRAFNHDKRIEKFELNPTNKNIGLISSINICNFKSDINPCEFHRELFLIDFHDETIKLIAEGIEQFSWYIILINNFIIKFK